MDEQTEPFAVPPGTPNESDAQQPPMVPRPQPPSSPTQPSPVPPFDPDQAQLGRHFGADPSAMPPLGPPYAAPAAPPPPTFPTAPPEEWPAPPPLLPVPPPGGSGYGGGGRRREPGDPRRAALWIAAIGAVTIVIVGLLAWGQSNENSNKTFSAGAPTTTTTSPIASNSDSSDTGSSSSDSGSNSDSSDSTSSSSSEPDLQTAVKDIEAFVARERGLPFKTDVNVQLVTDDQLTQMLDQQLAQEGPSLLESQQVLRALGLIPPTFDLTQAERGLLDDSVVGFYDPETKQLVVRGTDITPYVRETLAHELTHALDDQWFNLNRPQLDNADDETGFGFTALTEGDAVRVENAYLASLSQDEQSQAKKEEQDLAAGHPEILTLPQVMLDMVQEPYTDGPPLVQAILDAGDRPRLDQAFQAPPTTSEQVIDPNKFLSGEGAIPVALPPADGTVLNKGALGAFMFEEILLGSLRTNDVDSAIAGWGGDMYVTWLDGSGNTCLRDTFVGDNAQDTQQLADALNQWAPDVKATVSAPAGQPGTFTVCS